jgi:AhpD family alkylhydroperoxidase
MSQSKVSRAKKPAQRKPSTAGKSTKAGKPATARKSTASRSPARHTAIGPRVKRTISTVEFFSEVARKLSESSSIKAIYAGRLDEGFREQLMVAVAFQNQAPYCNWVHRVWASLAGVSDEQLENIEQLNLDDLDPKVATAVLYVRALVSSEWQDAPRDLRQQMHEHFSWREIEDIELIARAMDFGNRGANTWDAMHARLKGQPMKDSDLISEVFFSYLVPPLFPNRLRKVSRLTGMSVLNAAQNLVSHRQQFNREAASTDASQ